MLSLISGMEADRIARAEFRFRAGAAAAAAAVFTAGMLGFAGYATYTAKRIADNNVQIAAAAEETKKEETAIFRMFIFWLTTEFWYVRNTL